MVFSPAPGKPPTAVGLAANSGIVPQKLKGIKLKCSALDRPPWTRGQKSIAYYMHNIYNALEVSSLGPPNARSRDDVT